MKRSAVQATFIMLALCGSSMAFAGERGADQTAWDRLLHRYVDERGRVDYRAWHEEGREALHEYLQRLAETDVARLAHEEALAFWINAYNACVVQGVLDHDPLKSVNDVPGFFEGIRYRVAKASLTLNEMEGQGRRLGDWRIHFALVCASSSCPPLRAEAYVRERVNEQLAEQTRHFLSDPTRGLRVEGRILWLSRIFDWYATDFVPAAERSWWKRLTPETVLPRLAPYLELAVAQNIQPRQLTIKFLDYDWSLNAQ